MLNWLLFNILLISTSMAGSKHQFHVSKCLVEYNASEKALQISMNLFIDDLEEALRRRGADKLFICTEREVATAEAEMSRYLQEHFRLKVDGQPIEYNFLGKEVSEDLIAVWCYLEVTELPPPQAMEVTNKLLLEVFDDQKNIVSVFGPGEKKGLLLFQKGKITEKIEF